jgi:hypothetical protein
VARFSPLHGAAHCGDLPRLTAALGSGAAVNGRDRHGRTPVHVATFARQREAIRALVKAGADLGLLENDRYDAVTIAAVADDEETLKLLLALGASAKLTTSRYDGTALIASAHLGHDGVVRQLIAAGAPLDHVNNLHWTAAIEAVVLGDGGAPQATLRALVDARQLAARRPQRPHAAGVGAIAAIQRWSRCFRAGTLKRRRGPPIASRASILMLRQQRPAVAAPSMRIEQIQPEEPRRGPGHEAHVLRRWAQARPQDVAAAARRPCPWPCVARCRARRWLAGLRGCARSAARMARRGCWSNCSMARRWRACCCRATVCASRRRWVARSAASSA